MLTLKVEEILENVLDANVSEWKGGDQGNSILIPSGGWGVARAKLRNTNETLSEGSIHYSKGETQLQEKEDILDVLEWRASFCKQNVVDTEKLRVRDSEISGGMSE